MNQVFKQAGVEFEFAGLIEPIPNDDFFVIETMAEALQLFATHSNADKPADAIEVYFVGASGFVWGFFGNCGQNVQAERGSLLLSFGDERHSSVPADSGRHEPVGGERGATGCGAAGQRGEVDGEAGCDLGLPAVPQPDAHQGVAHAALAAHGQCQFKTILEAAVPLVECSEHGAQTVQVPWAEGSSRFTLFFERFAIQVLEACPTARAGELAANQLG